MSIWYEFPNLAAFLSVLTFTSHPKVFVMDSENCSRESIAARELSREIDENLESDFEHHRERGVKSFLLQGAVGSGNNLNAKCKSKSSFIMIR
jgi:hypothetical protein